MAVWTYFFSSFRAGTRVTCLRTSAINRGRVAGGGFLVSLCGILMGVHRGNSLLCICSRVLRAHGSYPSLYLDVGAG